MSPDRLLPAAVEVGRYMVRRWPQVTNGSPLPNYYFAGSLGTMLLAASAAIEEKDRVITLASHPQFFSSLARFPRPIADIDLVILNRVKDREDSWGIELDSKVNVYLEDLPEGASPVIKPKYNNPYLIIDGIKPKGAHEIATAYTQQDSFHVNAPHGILIYKVFNAISLYETKPDQFNCDVDITLEAVTQLYRRDYLVDQLYQIMTTYERERDKTPPVENPGGKARILFIGVSIPECFRRLVNNPKLADSLRGFLIEVQDLDKQKEQILV